MKTGFLFEQIENIEFKSEDIYNRLDIAFQDIVSLARAADVMLNPMRIFSTKHQYQLLSL